MKNNQFAKEKFRLEQLLAGANRNLDNLNKNEKLISQKMRRLKNKNDFLNNSNLRNHHDKLDIELSHIQKAQTSAKKRIAVLEMQISTHAHMYKRQLDALEETEQEVLEIQQNITTELEKQVKLKKESKNKGHFSDKKFDFFISHASEDKDEFVRPLAEKMKKANLKVWYDEFELKIGDSLRRSIDKGLNNSTYGLVILSKSFFEKDWTEYEFNGLINKELNGIKVILPIWHKVTKDDVQNFSLTLADKVALNSINYSIEEIVKKLKDLL